MALAGLAVGKNPWMQTSGCLDQIDVGTAAVSGSQWGWPLDFFQEFETMELDSLRTLDQPISGSPKRTLCHESFQ